MSQSRAHHAVFGSLLGLLFIGTAWAQGEAAPPAAAPARRADASTPTAASTSTNSATLAPGAAASTPAADAAAKPSPAAGSTAAATGSTAPSTATATDGAGIRVEKAGSSKLFRITEGMLVEGQRQKPNAFYVLQRASAAYDWESLDENFLQRIIKSTEKPPF